MAFPPALLLLVLLLGFLLQGGLEEWIVRGYVYHTLRERWRPWLAALASSLLFALLHVGNPDVSAVALVNIVLAGMVLAALVERTGSLWSATLAHGVWNFAVACLLSLPVSGVRIFHLLDVTLTGDPELTGGGFGPEGSWLLTLLGILLTVCSGGGYGGGRASAARRRRGPAVSSEDVPRHCPLNRPAGRTIRTRSPQETAMAHPLQKSFKLLEYFPEEDDDHEAPLAFERSAAGGLDAGARRRPSRRAELRRGGGGQRRQRRRLRHRQERPPGHRPRQGRLRAPGGRQAGGDLQLRGGGRRDPRRPRPRPSPALPGGVPGGGAPRGRPEPGGLLRQLQHPPRPPRAGAEAARRLPRPPARSRRPGDAGHLRPRPARPRPLHQRSGGHRSRA